MGFYITTRKSTKSGSSKSMAGKSECTFTIVNSKFTIKCWKFSVLVIISRTVPSAGLTFYSRLVPGVAEANIT